MSQAVIPSRITDVICRWFREFQTTPSAASAGLFPRHCCDDCCKCQLVLLVLLCTAAADADAERDIPAGQEVLHTYGDLADAQLLQTYGFIDLPPAVQPSKPEAKPAGKKRKAAADDGQQQEQQQQQLPLSFNPHNYVVIGMGDVLGAAKVVAAAAHLWPNKNGVKVSGSSSSSSGRAGGRQQQGLGRGPPGCGPAGRTGGVQLAVSCAQQRRVLLDWEQSTVWSLHRSTVPHLSEGRR